jgi:GTPase SAR1 family protein
MPGKGQRAVHLLRAHFLQIWDTGGWEQCQQLGHIFFGGALACLLVYNLSSPQSLEQLCLCPHACRFPCS